LAELRNAKVNWSRTLHQPEPDRRRELFWRGLHGLFGQEYYDARWSPAYGRLCEMSRLISPFLILLTTAILLTAPWRGPDRVAKAMGIFLLVLVVSQNLLLGANPRYVLPILPVLFVFGLCAAQSFTEWASTARWSAGAVFFLLMIVLAFQRQVLDWQ